MLHAVQRRERIAVVTVDLYHQVCVPVEQRYEVSEVLREAHRFEHFGEPLVLHHVESLLSIELKQQAVYVLLGAALRYQLHECCALADLLIVLVSCLARADDILHHFVQAQLRCLRQYAVLGSRDCERAVVLPRPARAFLLVHEADDAAAHRGREAASGAALSVCLCEQRREFVSERRVEVGWETVVTRCLVAREFAYRGLDVILL